MLYVLTHNGIKNNDEKRIKTDAPLNKKNDDTSNNIM
jgi:hypothetical protein